MVNFIFKQIKLFLNSLVSNYSDFRNPRCHRGLPCVAVFAWSGADTEVLPPFAEVVPLHLLQSSCSAPLPKYHCISCWLPFDFFERSSQTVRGLFNAAACLVPKASSQIFGCPNERSLVARNGPRRKRNDNLSVLYSSIQCVQLCKFWKSTITTFYCTAILSCLSRMWNLAQLYAVNFACNVKTSMHHRTRISLGRFCTHNADLCVSKIQISLPRVIAQRRIAQHNASISNDCSYGSTNLL